MSSKSIPSSSVVLGAANTTDLALSACVSGIFVIACIVLDAPVMLHWFVVPVFICGVLIGIDCFAWLRGRIHLFDAAGFVGAYGYYFFFVAPLLTVLWRYHTPELLEPPNWRDWVGWMAVVNLVGVLVYLFTRFFAQNDAPQPRTIWLIHRRNFVHIMLLILPICAAFQIFIFVKFGGLWQFMETFSSNPEAFNGLGWAFLIAEAFPMLLAIFVLVYKRKLLINTPWSLLAFMALAFFVTKMIFGGLRGSRSNTVWALFWLCGAIHLWIKPIPRKAMVVGAAFLIVFMYLYGFYKQRGVEAFDLYSSPGDMEATADRTGRTLDTTLLADLARSEIQAYMLYRTVSVADYDYAYGRTYLSAATVLIPKNIRPDWLPTKVEKGTEALHGSGSYLSGFRQASQVYGLAGEAILNFTIAGVPFAFIVLGFAVAKTRSLLRLSRDDVRRLLVPLILILCILVLNSDLDNIIVYLLTAVLPAYAVLKMSVRVVSAKACQ